MEYDISDINKQVKKNFNDNIIKDDTTDIIKETTFEFKNDVSYIKEQVKKILNDDIIKKEITNLVKEKAKKETLDEFKFKKFSLDEEFNLQLKILIDNVYKENLNVDKAAIEIMEFIESKFNIKSKKDDVEFIKKYIKNKLIEASYTSKKVLESNKFFTIKKNNKIISINTTYRECIDIYLKPYIDWEQRLNNINNKDGYSEEEFPSEEEKRSFVWDNIKDDENNRYIKYRKRNDSFKYIEFISIFNFMVSNDLDYTIEKYKFKDIIRGSHKSYKADNLIKFYLEFNKYINNFNIDKKELGIGLNLFEREFKCLRILLLFNTMEKKKIKQLSHEDKINLIILLQIKNIDLSISYINKYFENFFNDKVKHNIIKEGIYNIVVREDILDKVTTNFKKGNFNYIDEEIITRYDKYYKENIELKDKFNILKKLDFIDASKSFALMKVISRNKLKGYLDKESIVIFERSIDNLIKLIQDEFLLDSITLQKKNKKIQKVILEI